MLRPRCPNYKCGAFTLVELLVVLGIVTVLVALLTPAIARARKQATQVVCLSNLRQVGHALLAYAEANRSSFPAPGLGDTEYPEDWVHWQPGRDVRHNVIMPYLGGDVEVLKCPLGVSDRGPTPRLMPSDTRPPIPSYPFSYTVNARFTGFSTDSFFNPRVNGQGFARLGKIINPSEKAMMIEEDTTGINDGMWRPDSIDNLAVRCSSVSFRHDKDIEYDGNPLTGEYFTYPPGARGNVVFGDGHCEFYPRFNLQRERYTNPNVRE
jgi:prepilin-type processing-associated H-X9-DG protein